MTLQTTERGFAIFNFVDRYDKQCSLQKSSIATEDCIWLGRDNAVPQIPSNTGWVDVQLHPAATTTARMHLTRGQVAELLPMLQRFVETGEIS